MPGPYISAMHLFACFFITNFVRNTGASPGLANEPLIPFKKQKSGLSINYDFKWGVLRETTPSSMAALNTIPNNCVGENSL